MIPINCHEIVLALLQYQNQGKEEKLSFFHLNLEELQYHVDTRLCIYRHVITMTTGHTRQG